jgi:hypothetical protein
MRSRDFLSVRRSILGIGFGLILSIVVLHEIAVRGGLPSPLDRVFGTRLRLFPDPN